MWSHFPAQNRCNRKTKNIRLFGIKSSDYHTAKFWIQTDKNCKSYFKMAVWGVKLTRRAGGPLLSGMVFLYHVNDHLQTAF